MIGRIPVTVVSGFLGSGKTTLLCDLLGQRRDLRLAVLINELGEVSIDGALARGSALRSQGSPGGGGDSGPVEVVDFAQGLIAYAEDAKFAPTLSELARRRDRIDHVLIETSGVALPTAVMARLQEPELSADFVLDAALAVVDVPLLLSGELEPADRAGAVAKAVGTLFERQLEQADVVVLNKIDGLGERQLLEAEERVRKRAPGVRFIELAHDARLDARVALGLKLHQPGKTALERAAAGPAVPLPGTEWQPLADHGRVDGHSHSGLSAHAHGLSTHTHFHQQDPGWLSFVLRSGEAQDVARLRQAIAHAASSEPLLRCKGFVTDEAGASVLVQAVRTRVVSGRVPGAQALPGPARAGELVFIGYHLNRARVASILTGATGAIWR